jgi:hypothetical protein
MIIKMISNIGVGKQSKRISPVEEAIMHEAIDQFEKDNPRRKNIQLDMDFIVPLITKLRQL